MRYIKFVLVALMFALSFGCREEPSANAPKAPSNLSVSVSSMWLTLSWQDNSNNELCFGIERKSGTGSWELKYSADPNETTFKEHVSWTVPNPSFRVYANNSDGNSDYSNVVSVSTYSSASLWLYLCPDFFDGCETNYFVLNLDCRELTGAVAGAWYNTGFTLAPDLNYTIQSCKGCISDCGGAAPFETPKAFYKSNYYPGIYFYCNTQCTAPEAPE